jgi:hypothetical protein
MTDDRRGRFGDAGGTLYIWAFGDLGDLGDDPDDLDGGLFRGLDPALLGRFAVRAASGSASSSKVSLSSYSSRVAATLNTESAISNPCGNARFAEYAQFARIGGRQLTGHSFNSSTMLASGNQDSPPSQDPDRDVVLLRS